MSTEYQGLDAVHLPAEGSVHEHVDAEPLTNWATISQFVVQINKQSKVVAPIYANGRQQAPIEIVIQARDADGVAVNLTTAQLKSIRLIEYDNGNPVGNVSDAKVDRYIYQWGVSREDGSEVDGSAAADDGPGAAAQTVTKYVHKNLVTTNWIAAEITSPSGVVFRTNTPDPTPGKFDSWVKLQGREALIQDSDALTMERVVEVSNGYWNIHMYYIRFTDASLRVVWSVHPEVAADKPHSSCNVHGWNLFHIAYLRDSRRRVEFAPPSLGGPGAEYYINKRDGEATAVWIQSVGNYFPNHPHGSNCVIYVNQYGNEARCMLDPNDADDHYTMNLRKYGDH